MAHNEPLTTSPTPLRDRKASTPPFWIVATLLVMVVMSWIPLVLIARARVSKSPEPRIHLFQDMDEQPRYETQNYSPIFADHRAMRPVIPGTVARGDLRGPAEFVMGYTPGGEGQPRFVTEFPEQIQLTRDLLLRGQVQYNTYCLPCHGADGSGGGAVNRRAMELKGTWIPAANLHDEPIRNRQHGHLYNTIVNGIRTMGPYGDKITRIEDRWAVVAYVRALQLSQNAPTDMLPADLRQQAEAERATAERRADAE
jgi:mono/diheme cytochrome c family protein